MPMASDQHPVPDADFPLSRGELLAMVEREIAEDLEERRRKFKGWVNDLGGITRVPDTFEEYLAILEGRREQGKKIVTIWQNEIDMARAWMRESDDRLARLRQFEQELRAGRVMATPPRPDDDSEEDDSHG